MNISKIVWRSLLLSASCTMSSQVSAYCASQGNSTTYEWIDAVTVGSVSQSSGSNNGYADFTQQIISLDTGDNVIELTPGFRSSSYVERWKVWIDFDQDEVFSADEEVLSESSSGSVNGTIAVPQLPASLNTRMRVSMRYSSTPPACGSFTYGEVEDYSVFVGVNDQTPPTVVDVYPPANSVNISIDDIITVSFSEPLDPDALIPDGLLVTLGNQVVAGTQTLDEDILSFTPNAPWQSGTEYTVTVSAGIEDISGNPLQQDVTWTFTTEVSTPVSPIVDQVSPQIGAVDVPVNQVISVLFSNPMNPNTFNSQAITVDDGSGPLDGNLTVNGRRADFNPSSSMTEGTQYMVTVDGSVEDTQGHSLGQNYQWTFTTRDGEPDYCSLFATNPDVYWVQKVKVGSFTFQSNSAPSAGYTDSTSTVFQLSRTFSNSLTLTAGFWNQPHNVAWDVWIDWNKDGLFEPSERTYQDVSNQDSQGNIVVPEGAPAGKTRMRVIASSLVDAGPCGTITSGHVRDFRVEVPADLTLPMVTSVSPADASFNVPVGNIVSVNFSEPVIPASVSSRLQVSHNGVAVPGQLTFTNNAQQALFDPDDLLLYSTQYDVTLSAGVEDLAGNTISNDTNTSFQTELDPGNVHSLTGSVTDAGAPIQGALLNISGPSSFTVLTDNNGQYSFEPLGPGSYNITVSKIGYTFTPASADVEIVSSDISGLNFTGTVMTSVINNGDFESGTLSGFSTYETSNGHMNTDVVSFDVNGDGSHSFAALFNVGTTGSTGVHHGGGITQTIVLGDGDLTVTMAIAATAVSNNGDGGLAEVYLDDVLMTSHDFGSISASQPERTTLSFNLSNVQAGGHELKIQFSRAYLTTSVANYLDDIEVTGSSTAN